MTDTRVTVTPRRHSATVTSTATDGAGVTETNRHSVTGTVTPASVTVTSDAPAATTVAPGSGVTTATGQTVTRTDATVALHHNPNRGVTVIDATDVHRDWRHQTTTVTEEARMTATDNLPALRASTALAVIPKPPTQPRQHDTSGTLLTLAAFGAALTAFAPASDTPIPTALGMGAATITAAGLGIRERIRERRT